MLYITTDSNVKKINDVETFMDILALKEEFNNEVYENILKEIDHITYKDGLTIKTPFGTTTIHKASTGAKIALLAVYYSLQNKSKRKAVDKTYVSVDEAGENVLSMLAKLSETLNIYIYTSYQIAIYYNENIKIRYKGKTLIGGMNLYQKLSKDLNY